MNFAILAPVAFLGAAVLTSTTGALSRSAKVAIEGLAIVAILAAIAAFAQVVAFGPMTVPLVQLGPARSAFRLDIVSTTLLLLIAFVGWVVVRYSCTYLDREPGEARFMRWLCLTLTFVMMLVTAGTLLQLAVAWIATSLSLHRLLLFYPGRPGARRAARKKFVTARLGDVALAGAAALLAHHYQTGDIATLLAAARAGDSGLETSVAAGLIALAAMLKSAQFPLHGWLIEVMEAPTPVSALLHAGVINAGGFLLIRFADVLVLAPGVLAALVIVGGFTALFGSLAMLTQPAVKTSLAWSTVAQMGFMLMQCGLALFPLALLHIVAHSLYKAHSFLASGGAVERIAGARRPGPVAAPNVRAVGIAFLAALAIYATLALALNVDHKSPQALALGAILIFGVAYLLAQGLADAAPRALTLRMATYALAASISYFALHSFALALTAGSLPPTPVPGALGWVLIIVALLSFGLVAFAQALFPLWVDHPAVAGMRVHLANGLYANALFDRATRGWTVRKIN